MAVGGAFYAGPCLALWYPRLHLMTAGFRNTLKPIPNTVGLFEKVPAHPAKGVA